MKILVTGGAGFIGSHLVDGLIGEGHRVSVIDNLSSGKKKNLHPKAKFHKADIRDAKKMRPLFKGIDVVFHLAAIPQVSLSIQDPITTSEVNVMGTVNVFALAKEARVKRVVFASSAAVYGDQKQLPLKENAKPMPQSPYGLQKLVGEAYAQVFSKLYKIPITSLRFFNVYGPRVDFNSDYSLVIGKFIQLSLQGKPLTIFGSGKQTRDFCYIKDVVAALMRAMKQRSLKGGQVINIGSGEAYSINTLADHIGGRKKYLSPRPGDLMHTKAHIGLAKSALGWSPEYNLKEGFQETIQWFLKNK